MYIQYFTRKYIKENARHKQTNDSCMLMVGKKSCAQEMVLSSSSWDVYPYVDTNEQQSVLKALELNMVQSICMKLHGMYAAFVRFSFLPNQASFLGQEQRKKCTERPGRKKKVMKGSIVRCVVQELQVLLCQRTKVLGKRNTCSSVQTLIYCQPLLTLMWTSAVTGHFLQRTCW